MYQPPKKLNEKIARQHQAIIDKQLEAQQHVDAGHFLQAMEHYAELIQLLTRFKKASPTALPDAYRHYADANYAMAKTLTSVDSEKAKLHYEQAVLQLQQALLHYPHKETQSIKYCHQQLMSITTCRAEKDPDQDYPAVTDITGETAELMKQPKETTILHWQKTLLQRFLIAQKEAINEITPSTKVDFTKALIKI